MLLVFVGSGATAAFWMIMHHYVLKSDERKTDVIDEAYRRKVFQVLAATYNEEIIRGERWLGITRMRKNLLARARGQVLELAAGTGTNFAYYDPKKVDYLCAVDLSPNMITEAKRDAAALRVSELAVGNAEDLSQFADATFDTVVDTFGMCSYEHPERALAEMKRVVKEDGSILLLQHGMCRRTYKWMLRILNNNAERHAENYGCWWNRDVPKLVHEAGLDMPYFRMRHFRTTFFIVAKKPKNKKQLAAADDVTPGIAADHATADKHS
ncbi:MAG: class I SAM-dependent methyltransferase [Pseudomonadota bacterium]